MTEKRSGYDRTKQAARTLVGGIVLLVGIVAIPYPGPGWLIVFAGLAILARDYPWAQRILDYAKNKYDQWQEWIKRQDIFVQTVVLFATGIVVVLTLWLINAYGLLNTWLNLDWDWLRSPLI